MNTRKNHPDHQNSTNQVKPTAPAICLALLRYVVMIGLFLAFLFNIERIVSIVTIMQEGYEVDRFGSNFQEFVNNTRDIPYEVWGSFTVDGNKIVDFCSEDTTQVVIPGVIAAYASLQSGCVNVHTHPTDAPFSFGDLTYNDVDSALTIIMAISPNYTYFMAVGESGWPTQEELDVVFNYAVTMGIWQNYITPYGMDEDGNRTFTTTDALIEMVARQCDLHYYRLDGHVWPAELIAEYIH